MTQSMRKYSDLTVCIRISFELYGSMSYKEPDLCLLFKSVLLSNGKNHKV